MNYQRKNKLMMWYKVQELTGKGLNKSQIKRETGLDRATIRKYLQMDEDTFHKWIQDCRNLPKKLSVYSEKVKSMLVRAPYLSAPQVEDRLKEQYEDFPVVHSKTIYNFVQGIREKHNIPKPTKDESRVFEKLAEPPYGNEAQVDFGEIWMLDKKGKRKKVYFFAIVLSRSRFKHISIVDKPFTSQSAVAAHHLAFDYFQGIPKNIIYDQDSVFIKDENLGDYLLTSEFSSFCKGQDFKAVFCRKADPQSKGKVENVVKYVKQNFLRGREYINIEILNQQAVSWLDRTANIKKHSSTLLVPKEEWLIEKKHLLPVKPKPVQKELKPYKIRKDNTLCFKSNFYSLPLGSYQDSESSILLETKQGKLFIYTPAGELICTHYLSSQKGKTISNTDHKRKKSETLEILQQQVLKLFNNSETAINYLKMLHKDKSRYYRDNLNYLIKEHGCYSNEIIEQALIFCSQNALFNAKGLIDVLNKMQKEKESTESMTLPDEKGDKKEPVQKTSKIASNVQISDIETYEKIFS